MSLDMLAFFLQRPIIDITALEGLAGRQHPIASSRVGLKVLVTPTARDLRIKKSLKNFGS